MPDKNPARARGEHGASTPTLSLTHTQYPGTEESPQRFVAIGLDFGTAFTKVVIADQSDSFAVRLRPDLKGVDAYLLPGLLRRGADRVCELAETRRGEGLSENLKLKLIENPDDNLARANAAAFLALVLQTARNEFMRTQEDIFGRNRLDWHLNVGLPAESYDDQRLADGFLAVARAAWALSVSTRTINLAKALVAVRDALSADARSLARYEGVRDRLLHPEKIAVMPEVVAETVSYARSPLRNDGLHLLIDVGAGTLDVNAFNLFVHQGDDRYSLFLPKVFPLGAVSLARHRLKVLREEGLNGSVSLFDPYGLWRSRQQLEMALEVQPGAIADIDGPFQNKVGSALWDVIADVKHKYGKELHDWDEPVLTFLAGGGSADEAYGERVEKLSRDMQRNGQGGLQLRPLPKPERFRQQGVAGEHFHRFAVAYGLAQDPANLGDFISPRSIPFQAVAAQRDDWSERFVGAEQM